MNGVLLEICCGSADDVIEAEKGGANRVELNSNLFQGGLTPSIGALRVARRHTSLPIMAMVRPRAGGFRYTDIEFEAAREDAYQLLENGADGLVFGFLHEDGTVDRERTKELVRIAGGKPCVFHRALDVVPDWKRALDTLIDLGVTRVLTSGQQSDVFFALDTIAEMIQYADGAIEILPGAGITLENVQKVVAATGCSQVHLARHKTLPDVSVQNNRSIYYGGALYPPEDRFDVTDRDYVAAVRGRLG
ncbi:MAG: copper homeostasis protein CutC [Clostridia bacterium]|nr:copper homeostasis protein CutC [Clostridia bacterium]MBR0409249.1 copper homeostasis protein CutC [Clostridia bacterium]